MDPEVRKFLTGDILSDYSCGYSPDMLYEIQHKEKSPDVEVYIKDDKKNLDALRSQMQQRPVRRTRLKRR